MKTADRWFRGFPACWNVVIFYLFFSAGLAIRFGLAGSQTATLGLGAAALYFILLPFARGTAWARRSGKAG